MNSSRTRKTPIMKIENSPRFLSARLPSSLASNRSRSNSSTVSVTVLAAFPSLPFPKGRDSICCPVLLEPESTDGLWGNCQSYGMGRGWGVANRN